MRIAFEENTTTDIAEAVRENAIVIFPLACIEQHGPHLPLNCDYGRPVEAAQQAMEKYGAQVLILPPLPFGTAAEHTAFPGTISLSFETWSAVVVEVLENLVRDGFRRIVIAKGCGGQIGIEGPVYQFYCRVKPNIQDLDVRIFGEQAWAVIGHIAAESEIGCPTEVHAGGLETSMALVTHPDLVRLDRLVKPQKQVVPRHGNWWIMEDLSETGATGDPTRYNPELGKRIIDAVTVLFCDFLGEMWRT